MPAGVRGAKAAHPLSSSRCGCYFALLSPLLVWLQLFRLLFPTNAPISSSSVIPSCVLASSPSQPNDLLPESWLSYESQSGCQPDRVWKGTESVKINCGLTRWLSLSLSPRFALLLSNWKGGARTRKGRKRGNDKLRKLFCHLWNLLCASLWRRREGGIFLSTRCVAPRSKLSP